VDSTSTVPLPANEESVEILSPAEAVEEDAPVFNIELSSAEDSPDDERGGYYGPDDERGRDDGPDDERGRGGATIIINGNSSAGGDDDAQNISSSTKCVALGLRGSNSDSDTSSAEEDEVFASATRTETSLSISNHVKTINAGKKRRKRKGVRTPLENAPECRGLCGSGPKCLAKQPDDKVEDKQIDQPTLRRCANFDADIKCPLWIGIACAEKFECNVCRICAVLMKMPSSSLVEEVGR
jgi:hypothetical protein